MVYLHTSNINRQLAVRDRKYQDGFSYCPACDKWKSKDEFSKDKYRKSGCHPYCRMCLKHKKNEDVVVKLFRQCRYSRSGRANIKLGRKQIPFTITLDYARKVWETQKGCCAVSGIKFNTSFDEFHNPYSPSLDRIDSNKGYEVGNIRYVLFAINLAMNEWGEQTYLDIASKTIAYRY